jgi:hypothetical protein
MPLLLLISITKFLLLPTQYLEKEKKKKKAGVPKAHVCPPGTPEHD